MIMMLHVFVPSRPNDRPSLLLLLLLLPRCFLPFSYHHSVDATIGLVWFGLVQFTNNNNKHRFLRPSVFLGSKRPHGGNSKLDCSHCVTTYDLGLTTLRTTNYFKFDKQTEPASNNHHRSSYTTINQEVHT
jgi:hypothetical protein